MRSDVVVHHRIDRATRIRRWVLRLGTIVLGAAGALMMASVAHAFWTTGGEGIGLAATGTMNPATGVVVSSPTGSDSVSVSWTAASTSTGGAVEGYYVTRMPAEGGSHIAACGTSPTALASTLHCTDTGVPDDDYRYVVTAVLGSWTEASGPSGVVTVRFNSTTPSVVATTSPAPNANGYNRTSPVTLQLSATDSDGVASITYRINGGAPVTVNAAAASIPFSGDGTYTVTYSATDNLGGTSPTGTRIVRIDTVAPAAPSAPTLATASDTGSSSTDRITNDRTPTFTGTVEPGATVRLYSDGVQVGTGVASGSGVYSVTSGTLLAEGARAITVRVVDLADNVGALSTSTSVTIDVTGPSISPAVPLLVGSSDTGRSATDLITADNTPDIFGSARNSGAEFLRLYAGSVEVGSATATPTATITSTLLADGTHSITLRGSDVAGNLSPSSTAISISVDTAAPAAPSAPALTAASDTGASSTDGITNDSTPTVTGSNESSALVTLYAGASQVGTQLTASTSYAITSSALSDGVQTLTATATDVAGNTGPASAGTTVTVDTTAPTAPSAPVLTAASDSGTSSSDRVTNDNTPTFTGTATAATNVTLHTSAVATGAPVNAAGGSWTATTGTLTDGTHSITARTDPDAAGNVGISAVTTVTIDTAAPATPVAPALVAASDSGRSSSDLITNDTTPTFFDSGSPEVVGIRLYDGGVEVGSATASPSSMVTASALTNGAHAMTVRVHDLAGNISVSSAVQTVTIDTIAPAAPSAPVLTAASDTGASSTDRITNDSTPTVTGTNESSALVTVLAGTSPVGTHTTTSGSYSVTTSVLADGGHTLTATATDVAGNLGPASPGTTITIDTVAPTAPAAPVLSAASDSGVSSSDRITRNTTLTFTGTATSGSNVRLFDGETATGSVVTAGGGSYTATTGALANGSRTITARTNPDVAGNVGISAATTVTVDTAAPTVAVTPNTVTANPRFDVVFNEDVHGFTSSDITVTGTANPTTTTVTGSGQSYLVEAAGMNRTGTVVISFGAGAVTDTAGNASTTSAGSSTNYTDTVAPTIAVTKFVAAGNQTALVEGTVSTGPGDPTSVTVTLCTAKSGDCKPDDTVMTLNAPVNTSTGTWTVTSGTLTPVTGLWARADATDLSGNIRISGPAGPINIPAAAAAPTGSAGPAGGSEVDALRGSDADVDSGSEVDADSGSEAGAVSGGRTDEQRDEMRVVIGRSERRGERHHDRRMVGRRR